jgi:type IV pilus assembly protein PilO
MRFSLRDQLVLTGIGLLIVLILVGAFLVWPQISKMGDLDKQIKAARADVAVQKSLLAQRQQMKDGAAETNAKLLELGTMLPDQPELPSLIIELQDAAYASGVKVIAVAPQAPSIPEGQNYNVIPMDVTVRGTWADTVDFLQRVSRLTRALRTVNFSAVTLSGDEAADFPLYSVTTAVKVEAYSASQVAPAAAATSTPPAQ